MDQTQQPNKLDMSLDDIIKLERNKTNKRGKISRASNQRRAYTNRRTAKVLATRGRFSTRGANFKGRPGLVSSRFGSGGALMSRSNQPAATALAVLKRARKTAAAVVRAAKDAADILQRSRQQRQRLFDARRLSVPLSTAYRDIRGRGRGRKQTATRSRSFSIGLQANAVRRLHYAERTQSVSGNQFARRTQQRRQNSDNRRFNGSAVYRSQHVRGVGIRRIRDYVPTQRQQSQFSRQSRQNNGLSQSSFRRQSGSRQSRNAEYLAQARALIQAQNEQSRTGTFSIGGPRLSASVSRPPRGRTRNF